MTKTANEIRRDFLRFFEQRGHAIVPASPVVPHDDPTLLFTNAGMNQFKDVFLGTGTRDYNRAADTQKCIRAGGKHNDLDDVGHDTYHHTFFEMLGSWSFGDYFKADAIRWAWELLHEHFGIPAERLHATYFGGDEADGLPADEEARQLWIDNTGIDPANVRPFDKKDNFWEMADTGPCGPCTEIHVDMTPDLSGGPLVNADDPRVFEVWNLVFIQFNRDGDGKLHTLPAQHVDTGMGFERLVAVLQNKTSNYDTDVFAPLMEAIRVETGAPAYAASMPPADGTPSADAMRDVTYRIVADHLRCLSFAIADGALPDNFGRGYVLRRILRRAYRYGCRYLGVDRPFLHRLVPAVVAQLGEAFPELATAEARIVEAVREEEESFARTLDRGLALFDAAAERAADRTIDGETAFKLHDTYGFPIDLTTIIAGERGFDVDVDGYEAQMERAREIARAGGKTGEADASRAILDAVTHLDDATFGRIATDDAPKFDAMDHASEVVGWVDTAGAFHFDGQLESGADAVGLVLRSTCFYAEQGGQVGDRGRIETADGCVFEVADTQRARDTVFHVGQVTTGTMTPGAAVTASLAADRRRSIMAHHSATHLLNHALREHLGEHVQQKGSLVDDEKTRFDFSHRQAVTSDEIERIEAHVGRQIGEALAVHDQVVPIGDARSVHSLRAVFGEKYPDDVRVVSIGPSVDALLDDRDNTAWAEYSIELCGGTHVADTGEIGAFAVTSEEAVAKGVRRLVGVTGDLARRARAAATEIGERLSAVESLGDDLDALQAGVAEAQTAVGEATLPLRERQRIQERLQGLQGRIKTLNKAQAADQGAEVLDVAAALLDAAVDAGGSKVIVGEVPGAPAEQLREAADWLRQKAGSAAVLLFAPSGPKVTMLAALTKDLVSGGLDAKSVLREAGKVVGGGGGGRPDLAQGGGKNPAKVPEAIDAVRSWLTDRLD
ncbi:MAG: alanine--tRNA ligase [Acidobacteriota bacterium]